VWRCVSQATQKLEAMHHSQGCTILVAKGKRARRVVANADARLIVIGDAFDRDSPGEDGMNHADAAALSGLSLGDLPDRIWGSYVAIGRNSESASATLLRDPSGATSVYFAQAGPLLIVADAMPRWLREAADIRPSIDRDRLGVALENPLLLTHRLPLHGVETLAAGCVREWDGSLSKPVQMIWPTPGVLAAEHELDAEVAQQRLRSTVARSCQGRFTSCEPIILELSGGLDSTIVLGALASAPKPPDIVCVNFAAAHSGGDERNHAREATEHWNVPLIEITADAREFRFEDILQAEQPVEPVIFGMDPLLERASVSVAAAFDASAVLTGQGGDAVFYNRPTPWSAVDYARDYGFRAFGSTIPFDTALRAGCSIWQVYRLMIGDRFRERRETEDRLPGAHLAIGDRSDPRAVAHPWLDRLSALPPGRRDQLRAITNCQHFNSPTWRAATTPLAHPLLAQPIVEACLSIPTYQLSGGTINRKLARAAFADWLPTGIRRRRGKGDASTYYRRAVAENAGFLRDYLGNGTLVAHGFLNGEAIVAALEPESLVWNDDARLIATYTAFEAWARYWGLD